LDVPASSHIPAAIAHSKGRNFMAWWLYGFALWIIAAPHAILAKSLSSRSAFRPDGILHGIPYRAIKHQEVEGADARRYCALPQFRALPHGGARPADHDSPGETVG
jgi:hypothetical protein